MKLNLVILDGHGDKLVFIIQLTASTRMFDEIVLNKHKSSYP